MDVLKTNATNAYNAIRGVMGLNAVGTPAEGPPIRSGPTTASPGIQQGWADYTVLGGHGSQTDMTGHVLPPPPVTPITPHTGSGSGGGSSAVDQSQSEALSFIESMATAQEQANKKLADMLALREKIVASYGAESPLVGQMDTAIGRLKEQMNGLTDAQQQFWSTMSDSIVASINDWKGWGDFVRSVLSSLVQTYGPDFFTALLTPGQQEGTGLGTVLGNLLTTGLGGLSNIGGDGAGTLISNDVIANTLLKARVMPALARPDFAAVSKAISGGQSQAITIVHNNDFRGADPSMKPYLEAALAKRDRELPGKVVEAVREAKRRRVM
jgi:hypothetical protein